MKLIQFVEFCFFLTLCNCIHNPGLVIQIPSNLSLPIVQPQVPQQLPSIVALKLELTNIWLREVTYKWKLVGDKFIISLQRSVISFDWKYGNDKGLGTFEEEYSNLQIVWMLSMDKDARFKIDVQNAKITNEDKKHSIKVHLGGNVPETLVIILTNEILNNGKAAFRFAIKKVMVTVVQKFSEPLRKDVQLFCAKNQPNKQDCIYINTTLVSKPLIADGIQYIQVNGAPYRTGHSSGFLDPPEAIIKFNTSNLNVQIHQRVLTQAAHLFLTMNPIIKQLNVTDFSSVLAINSQTLSMVFPKMKSYANPRPILFTIAINDIQIQNMPPFIQAKIKGDLKVETQTTSIQPYLNKAHSQLTISIETIVSKWQAGARLAKVQINKLDFDPSDITNGLINPPEITKHLSTLMKFTEEGVNGKLNQQIFNLQFASLQVCPIITILNTTINMQILFEGLKPNAKLEII